MAKESCDGLKNEPCQRNVLLCPCILYFANEGYPIRYLFMVVIGIRFDFSSVADPGCLSRIPNPDFLPIPDLSDIGSRIQKPQQKRGVKNISCQIFFCSHKFYKIVNYFIFEMPKKKIWLSFKRIMELINQKLVTKL